MDAFTTDSFYNGRVRLKQHRSGYRYSIDAIILAGSARVRPRERVLDLGTGCGIIPLLIAFRHPTVRIWAVEIQPELASLAADNVRVNAMNSRIRVLQADMRQVTSESFGGPMDLVLSNPPYRRERSGRINPEMQRALARHEISITLPEFILAAARVLKNGGRFVAIYAAERTAELLFYMRNGLIEPKRMRSVHSGPQTDAKLILVEGVKNGKPGIAIAAPLIIYDRKGEYSAEIKQLFSY